MKVLMFGWEFPPHISGGLGTACAGLTHALKKESVEVLFVIPKLHGGEDASHIRFIPASEIPILQKKLIIPENFSHWSETQRMEGQSSVITSRRKKKLQYIEVNSFLNPYSTLEEAQSRYGLKHWNYSFEKDIDQTVPGGLRSWSNVAADQISYRTVKEPYAFSGSYGASLLEEVERFAQAGAEIARQFSFDVIHAHDWMTYSAGLAAKRMSGKPLVVHVHATEVDRSGQHISQQIFDIEKKGMNGADKVVAVSNWTKTIARQYYQVAEEKIEVVHNGITPVKKKAGPEGFTPPLGSHIVTFLGRITHQKGPMYFVEAARRVHQQFPDAHFIVAGSGDQLPLMIERIAQLKLSSHFHFTGFLNGEDINKVWSMSQVYVMPSVSEPFGIAPLEAIQAGVPVIISNQAGVSEVMPHAIKVDFWNSEALSDAICNLLRFKSLANTLRKNGAEQIKTITWDKAAKKLITLYYELNQRQNQQKSDHLLSGSSASKTAHASIL